MLTDPQMFPNQNYLTGGELEWTDYTFNSSHLFGHLYGFY